jgi:hypothetical protein
LKKSPAKAAVKSSRLSEDAARRAGERLRTYRHVEVMLSGRHYINGQCFGPGKVKVPQGVADMLLEQESRAREADERFHGTRAMIIGPGGRVKQVPPEMFDLAWAQAQPYTTA